MNAVEERGALRARRRHGRARADAAELVRLARFLDPGDRQLVEQVYGQGQPVSGLAALTGTKPGVLHRRLANLRKRMCGNDFRVVSECLALFPVTYRPAAEQRYLRGYSLERIVRETGLSMHQVRQRLGASRALIKVARALMAANAVSRIGLVDDGREGPVGGGDRASEINSD